MKLSISSLFISAAIAAVASTAPASDSHVDITANILGNCAGCTQADSNALDVIISASANHYSKIAHVRLDNLMKEMSTASVADGTEELPKEKALLMVAVQTKINDAKIACMPHALEPAIKTAIEAHADLHIPWSQKDQVEEKMADLNLLITDLVLDRIQVDINAELLSKECTEKMTNTEIVPVPVAAPEIPPAPAPITEAPTPIAEAPAPIAEAPAPIAEAPVPITEAPVPITEAPVPIAEAPVPIAEAPVPIAEAPVPIAEAPALITKAPALITKAPAPVTEAPGSITDTPDPISETPVPIQEAPAPVIEAPTTITEAPTPITEAPAPVAEAPASIQEAPASTPETSIEASQPCEDKSFAKPFTQAGIDVPADVDPKFVCKTGCKDSEDAIVVLKLRVNLEKEFEPRLEHFYKQEVPTAYDDERGSLLGGVLRLLSNIRVNVDAKAKAL